MKLAPFRDELDQPVYAWMISDDEKDRLTTLLDTDFNEARLAGTYLNAPPQICSHCGKETEFIDWYACSALWLGCTFTLTARVYTALARGVHSPEFLVESLKAGNTPKGLQHDVYCSRCGHLTAARDISGNEGGALHIADATVRV